MAVVAQHAVQPTLETVRGEFSGTAWYVVVASVAGPGHLVRARARVRPARDRDPGGRGRRLGAGGVAHAPRRDRPRARRPEDCRGGGRDGTKVPMELDVRGFSPYLAFPGGALIGLVVVFFGVGRLHRNDGLGNPHGVGSARAERTGLAVRQIGSAAPSHNQGVQIVSSTNPPAGPGGPEYLEQGSGSPARDSSEACPTAVVVRPSSPAASSPDWRSSVARPTAAGLVRPGGPAGRGTARLHPGLRQHRPRPQR